MVNAVFALAFFIKVKILFGYLWVSKKKGTVLLIGLLYKQSAIKRPFESGGYPYSVFGDFTEMWPKESVAFSAFLKKITK